MEDTLRQVQATLNTVLPLGPSDSANPMVCDVSGADRDAVSGLWQAPLGESQHTPLEFWRKTVSSSADNPLLLRKSSQPASQP